MKRESSIHITRTTLKELITQLIPYNLPDSVLDELMLKAAKKAISGRSITISNDKLKKDLEKRVSSSKGDADLLANIIYSVRIKKKHKGVRQLTQDSRDWLQLKELTKVCNQFCNEFNLEKRAGYIVYIEMGMAKISSMHSYITKLINMYESLCGEYDGVGELNNDQDKSGTMAMHDIYCEKVLTATGIPMDYTKQPNKFICFMRAREIANEYNCNYEDFINAQFEALDFCNGIPTPEQLCGEKALERLTKYIYQNKGNLQSSKQINISEDIWDKLKK